MANRHFGKFADLYKHLLLAEMLSSESPEVYLESHAGCATYPLTHSPERDAGIFFFLNHAPQSIVLSNSALNRIYRPMSDAQPGNHYHGSTSLAMQFIPSDTGKLFLCDTNSQSLDNIRSVAYENSFATSRVALSQEDGLTSTAKTLDSLNKAQHQNAFLFIDPFDLTQATDGQSAIDLFTSATEMNIKVAAWFGYDNIQARNTIINQFNSNFNNHNIDLAEHQVWSSLIAPTNFSDSILGCGFITANINSVGCCLSEILGEELAKLYNNNPLPDGSTVTLDFQYYRRQLPTLD